jgi:peptidoglycan/LPS O-acetylase OafA/YrhL
MGMQRMKRDQTRTFLVVTGALFVASGALVAYQVLSGTADPDDSFSRVSVTGFAALFTSAAMAMLLRRSGWRPWQKALAIGVNFVATIIACWLILNVIWP